MPAVPRTYPVLASQPRVDSISSPSNSGEDDDCSFHILRAMDAHRHQIQTLEKEIASLKAASEPLQDATSLLQAEHTNGIHEQEDSDGSFANASGGADSEAQTRQEVASEAAPQKGGTSTTSLSSSSVEEPGTGLTGLSVCSNFASEVVSQKSRISVRSMSSASADDPSKSSKLRTTEAFESMRHTAMGKNALLHAEKSPKMKKHPLIMQHSVHFHTDSRWKSRWEGTIGFLILANAVYLGWLTEAIATHNEPQEEMVYVAAVCFTVVFSLDLGLRVFLQRKEFFRGDDRRINLFDVVVVASMYPELLGIDDMPSTSALKVVRVLRLMRIIRTMRVFSSFSEFRLMVWSAARSIRSLVSIMSLSLILLYMAGLAMTDSCLNYCLDRNGHDAACEYFGTLGTSMLTLYKAILGGLLWGEVFEALAHVDMLAQAILVSFVSFFILLILNISNAFVTEVVQRLYRIDRESCIQQEMQDRKQSITTIRALFHEMDANSSGAISIDELTIACEDARMEALLSGLKLETHDMQRLFEIIDVDNTNSVDIEEFMLGCQRLRGEARTIDLVSLQHEVDALLHHVLDIKDHVLPDSARPESASGRGTSNGVVSTQKGKAYEVSTSRSFEEATSPHRHDGQVCRIKKVEERAMLLNELKQVCERITVECLAGAWTNAAGEPLNPLKVNLYEFAHWCICPLTVPDGITICGLQPTKYSAGEIVTQDGSRFRAEGVVMEDSDNGNVRVRVTRGRFESSENGRHKEISVNDEKRGVPGKLITTGAVSYKELIGKSPQKPKWYCSHWWGERIFEFVLCCEEHARRRRMNPDNSSYWVCGYANRQYDLQEDVSADIKSTAFWKSICIAEGILLVLDEEATPFKRIWCDFEIYQTLIGENLKMLDIVTVTRQSDNEHLVCHMLSDGPLPKESARDKTKRESEFPLNILAAGLQVELEKGSSSVEDDRKRILKYITQDSRDMGALQRANRTLNSFFARAAWPQAVKKHLVRDFDASQPGQLSLPRVMAQDAELKRCIMSLEHMDEVNDSELDALAEGLPSSLRELHLSFEGCTNISSVGIHKLAKCLPSNLQVLKLDCLGCRKIRDDGMEVLARAFPRSLQRITLHFDACDNIGIASIKALAEHAPRGAAFMGTFKHTAVDCNFSSLAELKRLANKQR